MSTPQTLAPVAAHPLRTSAFSATTHDDHLFDLRVGGFAALDRFYPTVRGKDWGLSQVTTAASAITTESDGFTVTNHSEHLLNSGHLNCRLDVHGEEGVIHVQAVFTAVTDVIARRIGLCLIHPMTNTGRRIEFRSPNGSITQAAFTKAIRPHALATGIVELSVRLGGSAALHVKAPAQGFDIEDHRNWGDPGWKTYLPPLASGELVTMRSGTTITHRLQLSYTVGKRTVRRAPHGRVAAPAEIALAARARTRMPSFGTVTDARLTPAELSDLNTLKPHHLLFQWNPHEGAQPVARASAEATALRTGLEVVVPADNDAWDEIAAVLTQTAQLIRVRVADAGATAAPCPDAVNSLRRHLRERGSAVPVGRSAASFIGLNRTQFSIGDLDFAAYGMTPQTHHTDDYHIMQTPAVQRLVLRQARQATQTHLSIGPITWTRPNAHPDPRLRTQIAAAWLSGLASYTADAISLTCFTARQLIEARNSPLAGVFTLLSAHSGQTMHRGNSTDLAVHGLAFPTQLLIANLGPATRHVSFTYQGRSVGVWSIGPFSCRILPRGYGGPDA